MRLFPYIIHEVAQMKNRIIILTVMLLMFCLGVLAVVGGNLMWT